MVAIRRRTRRGFTLIELLVVLVILGLLAALVVPRFMDQIATARVRSAHAQMGLFKSALDLYYLDSGFYPSGSEGLEALLYEPTNAPGWDGPYLRDVVEVPLDPWGNPFIYIASEDQTEYLIISAGPDGREDTDDDIFSDDLSGGE